jgi:TonB family protein
VTRKFHAPAAAAIGAAGSPAISLPAAPAVDTTGPELPALELPHLAAPALRTDNLAEVRIEAPSHARPRAIQAAGFSSENAAAARAAPKPPVAAGSFGDAAVAAQGRGSRETSLFTDNSGVEILFKPRPAYSSEARALGIEGEVMFEVLFSAAGEVRLLRLLRGLGHGLDESAGDAARQIRFRPARRDGTPVDSTAVVRIVFELAF